MDGDRVGIRLRERRIEGDAYLAAIADVEYGSVATAAAAAECGGECTAGRDGHRRYGGGNGVAATGESAVGNGRGHGRAGNPSLLGSKRDRVGRDGEVNAVDIAGERYVLRGACGVQGVGGDGDAVGEVAGMGRRPFQFNRA